MKYQEKRELLIKVVGIQIPATFYVYGARIQKLHVGKVIKKPDAEQGWNKKKIDNDKAMKRTCMFR